MNFRAVEATRSQATAEQRTTEQLLQMEMQAVRVMLKSLKQAAAAATGELQDTAVSDGDGAPAFAQALPVPSGKVAASKVPVQKQVGSDILSRKAKQKKPRKQKRRGVKNPESVARARQEEASPTTSVQKEGTTAKLHASMVRSVATDHAVKPGSISGGREQLQKAPVVTDRASKLPPATNRPVPATATKNNLQFMDEPELSAWAGDS